MKVAFVNQPIDTILPPNQSSVGACTYGVATSLGKCCDVIVYGLRDRHTDLKSHLLHRNVSFHFLPSTLSDRLMYSARAKYSKLIRISSPVSTSPWLFPAYGRQVATELQKQHCDVIHLQHSSQYVPVIRARNPRTKIVLHLHNQWFSQSNARMLKNRLRHVDLVTTVSNFVTARIRQNFPAVADRCETMYNGIDATEFCREKHYATATQRKQKQILCVGAVSPHLGTHVLLDAFEIILKQFQDVRLDIVGPQGNYPLEEMFDFKDRMSFESIASFYAQTNVSRIKAKLSLAPEHTGTYMSHLKARLSTEVASKVRFTGSVGVRSELVDYFYNADVFAFPAVCDPGFGLPPIEAMAAGTPVVASRAGATVETISDQKTGFLVEKNDSQALAEAILKLLENDSLRESMGRAARQRVLGLFTWDRIAADMNARYRALCETASRDGS